MLLKPELLKELRSHLPKGYYEEDTELDIIQSFANHFGDPASPLKFVSKIHKDHLLFNYDGRLVYCTDMAGNCNRDPECESCYWRAIDVIRIYSNGRIKNTSKDSKEPYEIQIETHADFQKVMNGITMYPFEKLQLSLKDLGYSLKTCKKLKPKNDKVQWDENIYLEIHDENAVEYHIVKNKISLIKIIDEETNFQLGDDKTTYYKSGKDLIVVNEGDVSSIVIFHFK